MGNDCFVKHDPSKADQMSRKNLKQSINDQTLKYLENQNMKDKVKSQPINQFSPSIELQDRNMTMINKSNSNDVETGLTQKSLPLELSDIVITNPKKRYISQKSEYYVLIQRVMFVKKTTQTEIVQCPQKKINLRFYPKFILSALYVAEGLPIDHALQIKPKIVLNFQSSPIDVKIKMQCKKCKRKIKLTYCKSWIQLETMVCPSCKQKQQLSIIQTTSNFPLWGAGRKIKNYTKVDKVTNLRVMGCVYCFKFEGCRLMKCGCYLCPQCQSTNKLELQKKCYICTQIEHKRYG